MTIDARPLKPATPSPGRGRPRDIEVDNRILAAARALLAQGGLEALSFEAVARIAGVTRPTIYRRWPSKVHLANEIANGGGRRVPDIIEERGLQEQIKAFVDLLLDQYMRPETGSASIGLIVSFQNAPDLRAELHTPIENETRAHLATIIDKGKRAGFIKASADADALFDTAVGAVMFRALFSSTPVSERTSHAICDILLNGIASAS